MPQLIENIEKKLVKKLAPERLEVIDESHLHAGHAGAREGGESHFRLEIVSEKFDGKSRIECHRMVHKALEAEMRDIHALSISTIPSGQQTAGKSGA